MLPKEKMSANSIKNVSKSFLNGLSDLFPSKFRQRVFYYHSVNDQNNRSHKTRQFYEQMKFLYDNGISVRAVRDIEAVSPTDKVVFLTFDDGYVDNLENAIPILMDFGFTATFFIATGLVASGDSPRKSSNLGHRLYPDLLMLNEADLIKIREHGMEIGSHGVTHQMFTRLTKEQQCAEIKASVQLLMEVTATPISSFAFPNGQRGALSEIAVECADDQGITHVFSTLWGGVSVSRKRRKLFLPRCEASSLDSLDEFAKKVFGKRDFRFFVDRLMDKSKAWK